MQIGIVFAVSTCFAFTSQASFNLVVNGDFENPVVTDPMGFKTFYTGDSLPGWHVTGEVDVVNNNLRPPWTSASPATAREGGEGLPRDDGLPQWFFTPPGSAEGRDWSSGPAR